MLERRNQVAQPIVLSTSFSNSVPLVEEYLPEDTQAITEIMETVIAPGGKLRISPYVQDALHHTLWGQPVDSTMQEQQVRYLLENGDNNRRFDGWALRWHRLELGQSPDTDADTEDDYAALLGLAPRRIAHVQRVLLDLLGAGQLPDSARYAISTSTPFFDAIAVCDFYLTLSDVCQFLHREAAYPVFPHIILHLDEAQPVAQQFATYFQAGIQPHYGQSPDLQFIRWGDQALDDGLKVQDVLIAELSDNDQLSIAEPMLQSFKGRLLVFAPEGNLLARWRKQFVDHYPSFTPLGPCGQEFGGGLPAACITCRIQRRLTIHHTPLAAEFWRRVDERDTPETVTKQRGALCAAALRGSTPAEKAPVEPLQVEHDLLISNTIPLRYIGLEESHLLERGDTQRDLDLCPGWVETSRLTMHVPAGRALPALRTGASFNVSHALIQRYGYDGTVRVVLKPET